MLYAILVDTYEKLEATAKRLEMTDILADLFSKSSPEELEQVIYLTQGKIHPDWTGEPEIGMAEKMVIETIVKATGLKRKTVEDLVSETGDIGHAAERALGDKRTGMLGRMQLNVVDVYNTLDQISKESGKGSSGNSESKARHK